MNIVVDMYNIVDQCLAVMNYDELAPMPTYKDSCYHVIRPRWLNNIREMNIYTMKIIFLINK